MEARMEYSEMKLGSDSTKQNMQKLKEIAKQKKKFKNSSS